MANFAGFRTVQVLSNVTDGTLNGNTLLIEVTNPGGTDVTIRLNNFPEQGHPASDPIPVKAGSTREIPMRVYNFTASGAVTVVAYGA
jgi:hypothetical protein